MDENPYSAPQTEDTQTVQPSVKLLPLLVPVLLMLLAYALFGMFWATPTPV